MVYIKSQGVIHRDIKCANVLVATGPVLKLSDFGLSKTFAIGASSRASTMLGTPLYVAPEVANGNYTSAVDMFSLGLVFVAILLLDDNFFSRLPDPKLPYVMLSHPILAVEFFKGIRYRRRGRFCHKSY